MNWTDYYDEEYFDGGKGYEKYEYSGQYEQWADMLIRMFNPKSVLDVGCAKGFLVKALRERGVPSWGVDISEYAIANCPEEVSDYLIEWDITSTKQLELPHFDLAVSFDTFEHIPKDKLHLAIMFMLNHGNQHYIRVGTPDTPDWQHDKSHVTIQPIIWWKELSEIIVFEESK